MSGQAKLLMKNLSRDQLISSSRCKALHQATSKAGRGQLYCQAERGRTPHERSIKRTSLSARCALIRKRRGSKKTGGRKSHPQSRANWESSLRQMDTPIRLIVSKIPRLSSLSDLEIGGSNDMAISMADGQPYKQPEEEPRSVLCHYCESVLLRPVERVLVASLPFQKQRTSGYFPPHSPRNVNPACSSGNAVLHDSVQPSSFLHIVRSPPAAAAEILDPQRTVIS